MALTSNLGSQNGLASMKSRSVWLCAFANVSNVFALIFITLYLTFGQYLSAECCVYLCTSFMVVAVSGVVLLRKRQLSRSRLEAFMEPVRKGVIAHRGGACEGPENTLLAFREAKKNGASSVEIDLEMTADGVAILLHDSTVDRTTDGTGEIKAMTFNQARKLNAAAKFPGSSDHFEQIPTVEEAVLLCQNLDMNIFFDVKDFSQEMIDFLVGLYKKYPHLYNTGMVCSFYPQVIYGVRRGDDEILTGLTTQPDFLHSNLDKEPKLPGSILISLLDFTLVWSIYNWLWFFIGNSAVLLKHTTVSQEVVNYWCERDVTVITWTVNTEEGKSHFTRNMSVPVIADRVKAS